MGSLQKPNLSIYKERASIITIPSVDFQSSSYTTSPFFSLLAIKNNTSFLAGSRDNLTLFNEDNSSKTLTLPENIGRILSIQKKNNLTIFAADNGLFWLDERKDKFVRITRSKTSKATLIDRKGKVWLGRYDCLLNYDNNNLDDYQVLISGKTIALEEDKQGDIWAGTIMGLYKIEENKQPLRIGKDSTTYFVKSIKEGFDSSLFVATCNNGVLQVNTSGSIINVLSLPYHDCFNTLLCEEKGIWIGGNKGIIYYNLTDKTTYHISYYDGLPSNEVNDLISIENSIWAATSKGLVQFPKDIIKKQRVPAVISIKKITVNEEPIQSDYSSLHLKYFQNNLKIEFETINFYLRGTTEFKYRLLPSKKWHTTYQPYAQFTNLKPGNYKFEVSLVNNVPIAKLPKISFSIDTPWWQKLWLQLVIMATIFSLRACMELISMKTNTLVGIFQATKSFSESKKRKRRRKK